MASYRLPEPYRKTLDERAHGPTDVVRWVDASVRTADCFTKAN